MSENATLEKENIGINPIPLVSSDQQKNPSPCANILKKWIKKIPYFHAMDYFRRKIYDTSLFDSSIQPLAKTLEEWPGALLIDTTNRCNAKCVWCPNPDLTNVGVMDMAVYRKIIDDYGPRGGVLTFGTFGEPLMDKYIKARIEYLQRYPKIHKIELLTNAFFLNENIIPVILDNGVGVDISLDELDEKTFEDVKKMSFDVVRNNIVTFLEMNSQAKQSVPVNIRIKTMKTVEETMKQELFKIITSYDCSVVMNTIDDNIISNWAGKLDKESFFQEHEISKTSKTQFTHKRFNQTNIAPCTQLWKWMVIYWDGSVVLCCADMFSQTIVGDLKSDSISEIWNGPNMKNYRNQMVGRKRFEVPLCQDCDIHLSWHNLKEYYDKDGDFRRDRKFIMG